MHAEFGQRNNKDYDHCLYRVLELEKLLEQLNEKFNNQQTHRCCNLNSRPSEFILDKKTDLKVEKPKMAHDLKENETSTN